MVLGVRQAVVNLRNSDVKGLHLPRHHRVVVSITGTRLVVDTLFMLVMVPFLDALLNVVIHPEAVCETTEPSPWWESVLDDHQGC